MASRSKSKRNADDDDDHHHRHHKRTCRCLDVWTLRRDCERRPFPTFKQPRQVGVFSLDDRRRFLHDDSQLKFLRLPSDMGKVGFDLNIAYEKTVKKSFLLVEKIDNILQWILHNRTKILDENPNSSRLQGFLNADFVSYRGLLTTILCTIYEQNDDWLICATKYAGSIYFCAYDTEKNLERNLNQTDREKLMSSWGYKFEQYMTTDVPDSDCDPDPTEPVNENHEFCCMVRSRLNDNSLLFGAEMDCLGPHLDRDHAQKTGSTSGYVELKTSRIIENQRQERTLHRFKFIKWWAQSFLIGIPKIYCGFRDDDGIVKSVEEFRTMEIPKLAYMGDWSASACMNFLDMFLNFVKKCVVKDDYRVVYKFEWKPRDQITCTELEKAGKYQILPEWYISEIDSIVKQK